MMHSHTSISPASHEEQLQLLPASSTINIPMYASLSNGDKLSLVHLNENHHPFLYLSLSLSFFIFLFKKYIVVTQLYKASLRSKPQQILVEYCIF